MQYGYIKLHRKILDNPVIFKDSDYFTVWCYLLLNATHKKIDMIFNGKRITLAPGQLITGRKSINKKLKINESKVQRILKHFENEHQIEQQKSNKNRLVTVVNWCLYQENEQQNEQQVNNKRTTTEQQVNTNKNVKNDNNEKNEKKKDNDVVFVSPFNVAILRFKEHRIKLKKPMTDHAVELIKKKLDKLANTEQEKIELINLAIERGWLTVYPIKEESNNILKKNYDPKRQNLNRFINSEITDEQRKKLNSFSE